MWRRHAALFTLMVCGLACTKQGQTDAQPKDPAEGAGPVGWQLKAPGEDAGPVVVPQRQLGDYPAGSVIQDKDAPGGGAGNHPGQNYPHDLGDKDWGAKGTLLRNSGLQRNRAG